MAKMKIDILIIPNIRRAHFVIYREIGRMSKPCKAIKRIPEIDLRGFIINPKNHEEGD